MINFYKLLFLLFPFVVFSQQKEILHKEYFPNGNLQHEWYTINSTPVKYWKTFYQNSSKHYQRNYNEDGVLTSEGWRSNNQKNGYTIEYTNKGKSEGNYINNLKENTWKYYTGEHLDSIINYHLHKKNGSYEFYSGNKTLLISGAYNKDLKHGYWKYYSKNKSLLKCGAYKNGLKNGHWEYYASENKIIKSGSFKNGLKNGHWSFHSKDGILIEQGDFKKNKKNKWWSFFHINGQLSHKCELKNNLLDGYCIYYNKNKIVKGRYYKQGKKTKEWNDWSSFKKDYTKL